jgi:hypothetical protein
MAPSPRVQPLHPILALLVAFLPAAAVAATSSTGAPSAPGLSIIQGADILVLEAGIGGAVDEILTSLGQPHDLIVSEVWTGINFGSYDIVFIAMDGGSIEEVDVAAVRTGAIDAGVRVCWFGGTCYDPFANGVEQELVDIDTVNFCWQIAASPQFTLVDPGHPLALGLPGTMNFANSEAGYYMLRPTDDSLQVVGQNGDGFDSLFFKGNGFPGGGTGQLVWLTNSPFDDYWTNPADLAFLTQAVSNCLQPVVPVELQSLDVD